MSKKYLVVSAEFIEKPVDYGFVIADSEAQAIEKFVAWRAPMDEEFREYVYEKDEDWAFNDRFWNEDDTNEDEEESALPFVANGHPVAEETAAKQRVRAFFGEHTDYADLYLAHHFPAPQRPSSPSKKPLFKPMPVKFPPEMMIYIWENSKWANFLAIEVEKITVVA